MRGLVDARRRAQRSAGPQVHVPGRLYGLRRWSLVKGPNHEIRLAGHGGYLWRAGGETTWADCPRRDGQSPHPRGSAPVGQCTCGLYAWHPWATITQSAGSAASFALDPWPGSLDVVGIVEAWGTVHVHREGFRALYARPVSLLLVGASRRSGYGRLVEDLAISHRAQLVELADPAALVEHCATRGIGIPRTTVDSLLSHRSPKGLRVDGSG